MEREIGYVVVEFNQASHQPSTDGTWYDALDDAEEAVENHRAATAATGRKERFAVGTVTVEEEDL